MHRVLAGHAVGHEQDLVRMHGVFELRQLAHHVFVDLQPPRGVEDDHAIPRSRATARCPCLRDPHDVLRVAIGVDGNAELGAERLELVDRGGTIHVGGDQPRRPALGQQLPRELRRGRRFAGTLQARPSSRPSAGPS